MNYSAAICLLYQGINPDIADQFSPEELSRSPLHLPFSPTDWTPKEHSGIRWLEIPISGLPAPVYLSGSCTSTLDIARELDKANLLPEWSSVLAVSQSAGRGQMRRCWTSPPGNLYAAMRIPHAGPFQTLAAAPAIGGLMAEALASAGCPVVLKWPNDLLQYHTDMNAPLMSDQGLPYREECHKVGGILLEERKNTLLAGIGINLKSCPPRSALRDNYAFEAGTLQFYQKSAARTAENALPPIVSIFTLWRHLAACIFSCYENQGTPDAWWPALTQKHLAFCGCRVTLAEACPEQDHSCRGYCEGILDGVTASGALRLSTEQGMETFLGGSLLPRS